MREWLIAILGIVLLAIVLDGIRRWRNARYTRLHMHLGMQQGGDKDDLGGFGSELPNGGARVLERCENEASVINQSVRDSHEAAKPKITRAQREPEQASLDLEESVPILMEPMELAAREPEIDAEIPVADNDGITSDIASEPKEPTLGEATPEALEAPVSEPSPMQFEPGEDVSKPRVKKREALYEEPCEELREEPVVTQVVTQEDKRTTEAKDESFLSNKNPLEGAEELLVINVMSPKGQVFDGAELRDALVDSGMRYGAMKIFHRFSGSAGTGEHQFCLANVIEPGNFDLSAMEELQTPGVCLLMGLPGASDTQKAFDVMAETAGTLAERLGGELKDENRSVMTKQTLEHYRQRIQDFERKQRLARSAL